MRRAYDVAAVRAAEEAAMADAVPGVLMERAAAGLAATCAQLLGRVYGAHVLVLVGSGDNGGDATYAAARLAARGAQVSLLQVGEHVHDDGWAAAVGAGARAAGDVPHRADLVIDGITGIGGSGGLREKAAEVVDAVADRLAGVPVVAVDLPSGIDADTGEVGGAAATADVTVTFGALKTGLLVDPGASHAGAVRLVDIGLDLPDAPAVEVLQAADVATLLPRAGAESDKYRRGVAGVSAGSQHYTGAAVLCTGGALRGGAGMVRYIGPTAAAGLVRQHWPEVVVGKGRVQAWAIGSGSGGDSLSRLRECGEDGVPMVADADAIAFVPRLGTRDDLLITPHAGELARLLDAERDDIEARRLEHARRAADSTGAVVLLKGSTTVVAHPDGRVRVNPTGTPALATAGSGDVLAGLAAALLAGGLDPFDAGSVAAWLHGLAGRLAADGAMSITAYDVLEALPRAMRAVLTS